MGWIAVIGLGGLGVGLLVYAEVGRRKGLDGLWGVRLVAGLLLVLCGVAALRATSAEGLGLYRLLSVYTLVIVPKSAALASSLSVGVWLDSF